ncbi:transmembrane protein 81 [Syngnathoides biaculeatus]|uniref:transmembrane protein 81 n=1 Tax=Syngnathoides biaculeatus TaxID=300417 RepID=UPI002ADE1E9F|nr:transmembrane protein 81 [Syngnathoides biaculeatus]
MRTRRKEDRNNGRRLLRAMDRMLALLLLLHHLHLNSADEEVQVQVVVNSTPCSVTCGMGVKVQTVCKMKDGQKALEEKRGAVPQGDEELEQCHDVEVRCRESWQCGLKTVTMTTGERLELNCLVESNKKLVNKLLWRVSWHRAPGVISSDDSLFVRWESPLVDLVVLDPVKEEHAGTYRCDVLDAHFRRLKTVYWGVRVLPRGVLNLDYDHAQRVWESAWHWKKHLFSSHHDTRILWLYIMLTILSVLNVAAVVFLVVRMLKNRASYKIPEDTNYTEAMSQL